MNIKTILSNNIYLSLISACLGTLVYFLATMNKDEKKEKPFMKYIKLLSIISLLVYGVLYFRNCKSQSGGGSNNISSGGDMSFDDLDLGNPVF